jgi:hypothetical protein
LAFCSDANFILFDNLALFGTIDPNRAVRQTVEAIDGVIAEFGIGESYASRIVNVMDERLGSTKPQSNESKDSVS